LLVGGRANNEAVVGREENLTLAREERVRIDVLGINNNEATIISTRQTG
jgi:hypothetical protein